MNKEDLDTLIQKIKEKTEKEENKLIWRMYNSIKPLINEYISPDATMEDAHVILSKSGFTDEAYLGKLIYIDQTVEAFQSLSEQKQEEIMSDIKSDKQENLEKKYQYCISTKLGELSYPALLSVAVVLNKISVKQYADLYPKYLSFCVTKTLDSSGGSNTIKIFL